MEVDIKGQRLFVAGLENGSVEVIDLRAGKWSKSILVLRKHRASPMYGPSISCSSPGGDDGMLRVFRGDTVEEGGKCGVCK